MDEIKLTIAIPVYNAKDYLAFAIQSCINQSFHNWELLLMEDGSTDGSDIIAREYADKDSRIHIISDGKNKGLINRLNQSIDLAKGQYYARMDADDIMVTTRIEEELNFLETHPNIDVVGSSIMRIDNNNKIIGSGLSKGKVKGFFHPTVMGKTQWFKKHQYAEWALRAEDFELWTRSGTVSNFYSLHKPLLFYREFGIPNYRKNFLSQRTALKVFSRYKEYNKPFKWFLLNTVLTSCKIFICFIFNCFGKFDFILKHRKSVESVPKEYVLSVTDLQKSISPLS